MDHIAGIIAEEVGAMLKSLSTQLRERYWQSANTQS
jgi:hypothetical protein